MAVAVTAAVTVTATVTIKEAVTATVKVAVTVIATVMVKAPVTVAVMTKVVVTVEVVVMTTAKPVAAVKVREAGASARRLMGATTASATAAVRTGPNRTQGREVRKISKRSEARETRKARGIREMATGDTIVVKGGVAERLVQNWGGVKEEKGEGGGPLTTLTPEVDMAMAMLEKKAENITAADIAAAETV